MSTSSSARGTPASPDATEPGAAAPAGPAADAARPGLPEGWLDVPADCFRDDPYAPRLDDLAHTAAACRSIESVRAEAAGDVAPDARDG